MREKNKFWLRLFFLFWTIIIFFIYYRQELIHNLDHLPIFIQEIIKRILFIR